MSKMKKVIVPLLSIMLFLALPLMTQAAVGGKAKGFSAKKYTKVVEFEVDKENFSRSLREFSEMANKKASSTVQYKMIIPPGKYKATDTIRIYSNMYIYAVGATINYLGDPKTCFRSGSSYAENVIIEGGIWTTKSQKVKNTSSITPIRLAHIKNVYIKDAEFLTNRNGHILEIGDAKKVTVEGCTFSGNTVNSGLQAKEAIQLDVTTEAGLKELVPYNGKGCHDILIKKNTFYDVGRGVGSHSDNSKGVESVPYSDIVITENNFKSSQAEAVFGSSWVNVTVSKNIIKNAKRAGIFLTDSKNNLITKNQISKVKPFSGERKKVYGDKAEGIFIHRAHKNNVSGNIIKNCSKNGIRVDLESSGNKLLKNKITSCKASGIFVEYSKTSSVKNNVLTTNKRYGIEVKSERVSGLNEGVLKKSNKYKKNKLGTANVSGY